MFIPLYHSLTLLANLFYLPLLSHSFILPKRTLQNLYTHTIINKTSNTRYKYEYRAELYFYNIISVKLMIILLLSIYIFFNMISLRTQMFNFIPRDRTITYLITLLTSPTSLAKFLRKGVWQFFRYTAIFSNKYFTLYNPYNIYCWDKRNSTLEQE